MSIFVKFLGFFYFFYKKLGKRKNKIIERRIRKSWKIKIFSKPNGRKSVPREMEISPEISEIDRVSERIFIKFSPKLSEKQYKNVAKTPR